MINPNRRRYRWGPIPGHLLGISHWTSLYHCYSGRLHKYYWPDSYVIFYKNKMLFTNEMEKLEVVGGKVFREIILKNKKKKIWQVWKKYLFNLLNFCKKINNDYLKSLPNFELREKWMEFNNLIHLFWESGIIPELGAYGGEPILKEALNREKLNESEKKKTLSILSAPTKLSFYQEEELDLLKLVKNYRADSFNKLLSRHQQKYFWLGNSYFRTRVLEKFFFLRRIKGKINTSIKPDSVIKEINNHLKLAKQNKLRILARLKNKKEIKKISDGLSYCIWWQDHRKKFIFQYLHFLNLFVKEFARRAGISPRIFDFAWPHEVSESPSRKLINLLRERKAYHFVVYFFKNNTRCYYKDKAKKIFQTFWFENRIPQKDQLEGLMVYASNKSIIGQVYIIRNPSDIKKFPKGKILITTMTAPDYISAIRRAKAIVTDAGGITCHAAIVSRELRVPCLVGTRMATKFLKNNDIIEIDTQTGVVKKI